MTQPTKSSPIDYERLILAPVLALLLGLNGGALIKAWGPESTALDLLQKVLTTGFYVLLVVLILFRRPAVASTQSKVAIVAAYVASFLPFALVLNTGPHVSSTLLTAVSIVLIVLGMVLSIHALACLGRSFGVIPAARRLVTNGPFRIVRHPLYVAEDVALIGVVLGQLSIFSVAVLVFSLAVQVYRALQEEKVLAQAFPDYEEYSRRTARFIPGII